MSEYKSEVGNQLEDLDEDVKADFNDAEQEEALSPITNIQDVKFYHILAQMQRMQTETAELSLSINNLMCVLSQKQDRIIEKRCPS